MKLSYRLVTLDLSHPWTIARGLRSDGSGGANQASVIIVELTSQDGLVALGEAAPSRRYQENNESVLAFLSHVAARELSFTDIEGSMAYLDSIAKGNAAAKGAVNIALLDGAAQLAQKPVYDFLNLGFTEDKHVTSFSIGIASPEAIRAKVREAHPYPILKLKVGSPNDRENLAALRDAAPTKTVRVDGNEAWKTKEEALKNLEWLAADPHLEFVEQPMPADTPAADLLWLKERTPLPLMADEAYLSAADLDRCLPGYHSVNVKLAKTSGISGAHRALEAARKAGLKTMIGCMIETSVLITAAAHLAELTDYLDIDGNLLIRNDPYLGVTAEKGALSFRQAPTPYGLRVTQKK